MKINLVIILNALLILMLCYGCSRSGYKYRNKQVLKDIQQTERHLKRSLPRQSRQFIEGMRFMPRGHATSGYSGGFELSENDTNLLIPGVYSNIWWRRYTLNDFFISKTEVSVDEYYEFVVWVVDSVLLTQLAQYDASFYLDNESKKLNWDKREVVYSRDTSVLRILEPLSGERHCRYCFSGIIFEKSGLRYPFEIIKDSIRYKYISGADTLEIPVFPEHYVLLRTRVLYAYEQENKYFHTSEYADYPMLGTTWHQANAYCHWRTQQARNAAGDNPLAKTITFRLPTEAEWEYAALSMPLFNNRNFIYPWRSNYVLNENFDKKKKNSSMFMANFYTLRDKNNIIHKPLSSGILLHPVNSKVFAPNELGLHHMAGNVAEWTSDDVFFIDLDIELKDASLDSRPFGHNPYFMKYIDDEDEWMALLNETEVTLQDDMQSAMEKIKKRQNYLISKVVARGDTIILRHELLPFKKNPNYKYYLDSTSTLESKAFMELYEAKSVYHNQQVISRNSPGRIVKGGSWRDSPVYLIIGNREYIPENHASARIGFRVVMTINREEQ